MQFVDNAPIAGARLTSDGYLVADVRCARTGCQDYLASELGQDGNGLISVYRPESAVFHKDSLATFAGKPICIGHPIDKVTADNWRQFAVGDIGEEIARDGETIRVTIKLMDAAAIKAVQDGTREISMGYSTAVEIRDGVAPDGTAYQAVQVGPIKINHLALVQKARGGQQLRIGDGASAGWGAHPIVSDGEPTMADAIMRTVIVDGFSVLTTDQGAQALEKLTKQISDAKTVADKALADAIAAHATEIAAKDTAIGGLKADLKTAQDAALKPGDLDKLVKDRASLEATVKALDATIDASGKTDADLRKAAVTAKLGDATVKDASEAEIVGMFKAITKDVKPADAVADALKTGFQADAKTDPANAREKMIADMKAGYKPAAA